MKCLRLLAPVLLAATSSPLAQSPVFRSGVDLVRLDIRVTDDDGRPIADLRPDEVQIKEEGRPRPVLLFQHVEAPRGTYSEAAARTIAAEVSTNQGSPRGHVYVLVFDEAHIQPGHEQRARLAAERFLRTRVRSGDRVALYALPGPGPHIEFTADVSHVAGALKAVRGAGEETGTGTMGTMRTYEAYEIARGNSQILERQATLVSQNLLASDTRSTVSKRPNPLVEDPQDLRRTLLEDARSLVAHADGESRRFLVAFADVIRTLRSIDGRKAVILFSEGFQTDNVTRELEDVAAAAAQSFSVVYAMDLNPNTVEVSDEAPRGGERMTEVRDRLQSLGSLTAETAGTLVTDASSQLDRALARIAETTEDYYLVGFTPAGGDQGDRNRYRRIQVIVTRPGARVNARTGYAPNPGATPADRRRAIDAALRAPFSKQELRLEYTTYTLGGSSADMQRVIVSLAAELPVASAEAAAADVVYVVRNVQTGKVAASGSDRIAMPETPRNAGATTGTGVYRVQFELLPGTYLMRAVVREPGGLLGSADRRFQVRALNGPDVTASDLVLGSPQVAGLPVYADAYVSDVLNGVFELYGRTEGQLEALTVTADLVPVDGGPNALSTRADLQPIKRVNGGVSRGVRVELPLTGVAPGRYLVRATIRDGRDTIAERLREVTVRAGSPSGTGLGSLTSRDPSPRDVGPSAIRDPSPRDSSGTGLGLSTRRDLSPVEPLNVLQGDVVRHLVTAIQARAHGAALEAAARAAVGGKWPAVAVALASSSSGSADESILRGIAAFARADYATAITAFRGAQTSGADDPALAFVLGWAHAGAGDDRAAVTDWRNAVLGDAAQVASYLALVDAYVRLDHADLALQVVRSGLRALPGSPELLDRLARLEGR